MLRVFSRLGLLMLLVLVLPVSTSGSPTRPPWVILVAVVGLDSELLYREEAQGDFPAISRLLRDGVRMESVYAPVPAQPETALAELICGRPAGEILPARTLLRDGRILQRAIDAREELRLDRAVETIFHFFPRRGLAMELPLTAGAARVRWLNFDIPPKTLRRRAYLPSRELGREFAWLSEEGLPELTVILLQNSALSLPGGETRPRKLLRELDRLLGMLTLRLRQLGQLDRGLIVCVGLPGVPVGGTAVRLDERLQRDLGVPIRIHPGGMATTRRSPIRTADNLLLVANGRLVLGYSRMLPGARTGGAPGQLRSEELFVLPGVTLGELIRSAVRLNEVEWLAWIDEPGSVRLRSRLGEAVIRQQREGLRYTPAGTIDPLGWMDERDLSVAAGAGLFSADIWLKKTKMTKNPGAAVLLHEFFQRSDPPTFALLLRENCHLAGVDRPGCGGGLTRRDLLVPAFFHGAGLRAGRIRVARLRDVLPTILEFCGIPHNLPGRAWPLTIR